MWLALVWAWLAWRLRDEPRSVRVRLIAVVAVVSLLVFAPWAARNWAVFGNPLPGQAISNAMSVTGFDIFAWNDPPTMSRYLAVGPAGLLEMRVTGIAHNLFNVLLLLGIPMSVIGLLALPWQGRDRAVRPILLVSLITFLVTSLLFPVATTWGTFLHAAVPAHVLLLLSGLGALDAGIARLGRRLAWDKPVAWLGPLLAIFASLLFSVALLPSFGGGARATERHVRGPRPPDGRDRRPVRRLGAGHPRLPDLARGDRARAQPRAAQRVAVGRPGPGERVRRPLADQRQGRPRRVARDPRRRRPGRGVLRGGAPARSRTTPSTPPRSRGSGCSGSNARASRGPECPETASGRSP